MTIRTYADTLNGVKKNQRAGSEENRMPTSEQTFVKRVTELVAADSVSSPDPSCDRHAAVADSPILHVGLIEAYWGCDFEHVISGQ